MTSAPGGHGPLVYLVAGEASGDELGSRLMRALKAELAVDIRFAGVGGDAMSAEGLQSLFPMRELSLMGFVEIVPHIPRLMRRIRETAADIRRCRPDVVVTIDSPDFNFRVGKRLAGEGIPLVHYVGPSVWAYRPGRAAKIARFLDHLLVLFPFEPPYFEAVGLPTTFVGHPLVEAGILEADGEALRTELNAPDDAVFVTVLPGSRRGELARHLALFGDTIRDLATNHPNLNVLLPAAPGLESQLATAASEWPVPVRVLSGTAQKYAGFALSRAALAVSGTVTLELAIAGVPMVVAYKANPMTMAIARRIVRIPYISLGNLVLGEGVAPEFIQEKATSGALSGALHELLVDGARRNRQIEAWQGFAERVSAAGASPSVRAARAVRDLITGRQSQNSEGGNTNV